MHRDVLRVALGRAAAALALGLAATAACSDELTEPPVEAVPAAADRLAMTAGDRAVLVAVYEATGGSNWITSDKWLTDAPLNAWHGVETDASGRVQGLDLAGNDLTGKIPPELGNLASLKVLDLGYNGLTGEIPPELGNLANLRRLNLTLNNGLTGEIPPELDNLASLRRLDLSGNRLTGEILPELGNLANLESLYLFSNRLTGKIPSELGNLASLEGLLLGGNGLTGEIPPELGNLANLELLSLFSNGLTGAIPPELGSLTSLWHLNLSGNGLTGAIPPELGNLANLEALSLSGNGLTGEIPSTFNDLSKLSGFSWDKNAGLCAPGTRQFIVFADSLDHHAGPFCHEADAAVLRSVYHSTRGSAWTSSDGWLKPGPLANWYGVETDSVSGRVSGLDLSQNGLSGELLVSLASLDLLRELRLDGNGQLGGRLWSRMTVLPLRTLSYDSTDLCTPANPGFRTWLRSISSHSGTGNECPPLTDRDVLGLLFESTGGRSWAKHDNWLTDAPLDAWHGVVTDASGRIQRLDLSSNDLTGRIPPELGTLANLEELDLRDNDLTGEIPSELGNLANLRQLDLGSNDGLTGEIPPELGNLANLEELDLRDNGLTGAIPPELSNLANLRQLDLGSNDGLTGKIPPELGTLASLEGLLLGGNGLTGEIPAELGGLANLEQMRLSNNGLTGKIPAELGNLANLRQLNLGFNGLTGEIPPELGNLANLEVLTLAGNPDLSGALPLANLVKLRELVVGGTELCVPDDFAIQLRLRSVWKWYVPVCKAQAEAATATAYIVQAVQSADVPVPLVAGQPGLLRVFVTAPDAGGAPIPSGWATFYQRDGSKDSVRVSPGDGAIPARAETAESSLSFSANAKVPADVLQPGAEIVVVLDPEGALDPALGVPRRIPAAGRTALDVYDMPAFDVMVVPFLWESEPDSSILDVTKGLTAEDELFEETRRLLPVGPMSVTVHAPVWTSTNDALALLSQTRAIRVMEGGAGYYMSTIRNSTGGVAGLAYSPGKVMYSVPDGGTIAHEFGHNMHLWHAPCGTFRFVDRTYPHAGGRTGAWGWSRRSGHLVSSGARDVMGYCGSEGISDYHFANALRWRLRDEAGVGAYYAGPPTQALLLWGGVGTDGAPFLNPAFVFDGRPSLLDGAGAWRIVGEGGDGRVLFSQRFEMAETTDGDGRSAFALALAANSDWADALSRIVLTGPGGSVAMSAGTGPAAALLRDPATGRVRGILRDWGESTTAGTQPDARAALPERGLEIQVSSGIPRSDAWRR